MHSNLSIYASANKYGYKLNINHPEISKLYLRFKKWKGISVSTPLSDAQRFEFEEYVLSLIEKKNNKQGDVNAGQRNNSEEHRKDA